MTYREVFLTGFVLGIVTATILTLLSVVLSVVALAIAGTVMLIELSKSEEEKEQD